MSASREEWIAKLAGASGYAAIFDLAAQALSSREAWGDDLRSSQAAARKWAGFFFPVEAIESGATIAGRVAPRAEILAAGEAAAKAVAIELLAPLPATAPPRRRAGPRGPPRPVEPSELARGDGRQVRPERQ